MVIGGQGRSYPPGADDEMSNRQQQPAQELEERAAAIKSPAAGNGRVMELSASAHPGGLPGQLRKCIQQQALDAAGGASGVAERHRRTTLVEKMLKYVHEPSDDESVG